MDLEIRKAKLAELKEAEILAKKEINEMPFPESIKTSMRNGVGILVLKLLENLN